jgi:pimeloyl-ACP methyl ester carboxylesterase
LTLRYALAHPERVLAHVFTNSNSALAPEAWTQAARPGMEALAEELAQHGLGAIERLPIHPKRARQLPAEVKAELIADCTLHAPIGIANSGCYTVIGSSVRDRVASNRVPTLLVHGARERRFAEHARFATERIPHLSRTDLDAGHAVNLESPTEFDAVVRAFVRRITG